MDSFIQHISQGHNTEYITPSAGKLAEGFFICRKSCGRVEKAVV
nr:MAG TPA: hypothetical protein [Caudoviricetes sp.]